MGKHLVCGLSRHLHPAVELVAQAAQIGIFLLRQRRKRKRALHKPRLVGNFLPVRQHIMQRVAVLPGFGIRLITLFKVSVCGAQLNVANARQFITALVGAAQQAARAFVIGGQAFRSFFIKLRQHQLRLGLTHDLLLFQLNGAEKQPLGTAAVGLSSLSPAIQLTQCQAGGNAQLGTFAILGKQLLIHFVAQRFVCVEQIELFRRFKEHGAVVGDQGIFCRPFQIHAADLSGQIQPCGAGGGLAIPGIRRIGEQLQAALSLILTVQIQIDQAGAGRDAAQRLGLFVIDHRLALILRHAALAIEKGAAQDFARLKMAFFCGLFQIFHALHRAAAHGQQALAEQKRRFNVAFLRIQAQLFIIHIRIGRGHRELPPLQHKRSGRRSARRPLG